VKLNRARAAARQRAAGRNFSRTEEDKFRAVQTQAQRWTYLGSAMAHPQFLKTVGEISPAAQTEIEEMSKALADICAFSFGVVENVRDECTSP
jgi:hypothetical protein